MMDLRRDVLENSKVLMALLRLAVILCLIWQLSNAIATGAFQSVLMLGAGVVVLGAAGKIFTDWRSGVYLLLTWLLFEDLVRKYMGNNMYVYFGKDVLIAVAYVSFSMSRLDRDTKPFRPPFMYALSLFSLLCLVQVFNPASPSFYYGALGLKLYLYYIPLMFAGYALLRSESD